MYLFAELNAENIVVNIHSVAEENTVDSNENFDASVGISYLEGNYESDLTFIYSDDLEKMRIGSTWDFANQRFIVEQPFDSWTLSNGEWVPPVAYPSSQDSDRDHTNGHKFSWNEETQSWDEVADFDPNIYIDNADAEG